MVNGRGDSSRVFELISVIWIAPLLENQGESLMFARRVYMHLKPDSVAQFTQRLEKDVLPLLRKQKGFQDEITFVGQSGREAFGISVWDRAEDAEAYNRGTYPEVAKILAGVIDGAPQGETFKVASSTFHKIAAALAV